MMKFWIRQKSTGYFMPAGRGQGFTADKPRSADVCPPRLFGKRGGATNALRWWLQGEAWADQETGDIHSIPKPERNADDMELVVILLTVVT